MNVRAKLKTILEYAPSGAGSLVAHIPYSFRLGRDYTRSEKDIAWFATYCLDEIKHEITRRVRRIVTSAYQGSSFYRHFYENHGICPDDIRIFEDIGRLPIVGRSDLKPIPLEDRSCRVRGRMKINTGGTSGEPLHFYIDRNAFAREWGHMHFIWGKLGYKTTDLKLTFRGKNLGMHPIRYNAVHNEYLVNGYRSHDEVVTAVGRVARGIRFIHGYPSSIYEFVRQCLEKAPEVLVALHKDLKGILYASEYPAPAYRNLVDEALGVPSISWYGHSEMAILAYEMQPYVYVPLQSYGFCEAVKDDSGRYRLVGTSYYNDASPFIRYDTGDYIDPLFEDGLLKSFRVTEGRVGDFIVDSRGSRISLTALIFGRHHPIFEDAKFIQVRQDEPGRATLLVTAPSSVPVDDRGLRNSFDLSDVDIRFSVERLTEPVRSAAGKVPLLVTGALA